MTIHLLRMAAGVEDLAQMQAIVKGETRADRKLGPVVSIYTRNWPKRAADLLDGGSVYSVIRSVIQVRRRVLDIREWKDSDGSAYCRIVLDPQLIRVMPTPQKPFQGWRYLDPLKAPRDLGVMRDMEQDNLPDDMAQELKELGLL